MSYTGFAFGEDVANVNLLNEILLFPKLIY